jgi:hypothetical protein
MSKSYNLNRIKLTGKLTEKTPSCVIQEILKSHNICNYKKISSSSELLSEIQKIETYRCHNFAEPLSLNDLRLIATFVNADSNTWTKSSLLKAYDFMFSFNKEDLSNICYGQLSYETPNVYNACMLYSLCVHYNINTYWNMTVKMMVSSLKNLNVKIGELRNQVTSYIQKLDKSNLINLINFSSLINLTKQNNVEEDTQIETDTLNIEQVNIPPLLTLDNEKLLQSLNRYKDTSYLLKKIIPQNHTDAIILAALIYNLNLTESTVPLQEFLEIKKVDKIQLYVPVDLNFRKKYLCNSTWYNLSLHWEPKLSFIYDETGLIKLCTHEGYEAEDFRNYGTEALLQISRISMNVYMGKNPYYSGDEDDNTTPIELHDITELSNNQCLTLGNIETKEMSTYKIEELAEYFIQMRDFTNPHKITEMLENRIIKKIKIYASNALNKKMLHAIEVVEDWKKYSSKHTEKLRNLYKNNSEILILINKILEAGLYMRGWKVTSQEYPIKENKTQYVTGMYDKIESNVATSIDAVFECLKTYSIEEQKVLNELPLFRISVSENINKIDVQSFVITPDLDDGHSIFERLKIVANGDTHKNVKSCIRVSSNIILISVFYYTKALGLNEPFDINDLDHIS